MLILTAVLMQNPTFLTRNLLYTERGMESLLRREIAVFFNCRKIGSLPDRKMSVRIIFCE